MNIPPSTIHEHEGVTIGLRFAHHTFYRLHVDRMEWVKCSDAEGMAAMQVITSMLAEVPFAKGAADVL